MAFVTEADALRAEVDKWSKASLQNELVIAEFEKHVKEMGEEIRRLRATNKALEGTNAKLKRMFFGVVDAVLKLEDNRDPH